MNKNKYIAYRFLAQNMKSFALATPAFAATKTIIPGSRHTARMACEYETRWLLVSDDKRLWIGKAIPARRVALVQPHRSAGTRPSGIAFQYVDGVILRAHVVRIIGKRAAASGSSPFGCAGAARYLAFVGIRLSRSLQRLRSVHQASPSAGYEL